MDHIGLYQAIFRFINSLTVEGWCQVSLVCLGVGFLDVYTYSPVCQSSQELLFSKISLAFKSSTGKALSTSLLMSNLFQTLLELPIHLIFPLYPTAATNANLLNTLFKTIEKLNKTQLKRKVSDIQKTWIYSSLLREFWLPLDTVLHYLLLLSILFYLNFIISHFNYVLI